jgi:protein-S-isoprenylcysteine O-methyltransferase Ste14
MMAASMIERFLVTALPVLFLIVLFGGGERFRRRHLDMDGDPPIGRTLFYLSKYAIVLLWAGMVAQSWGAAFWFLKVPASVTWVSLALWVAGFALLFIGRLEMGDSFRIGSPQERTALKVTGLFRLSRNPMYLGVFATLAASVFYTLNPVLLLVAIFIVAVHHRIVLAEEEYLRRAFGADYAEYCRRVRRYL